MTEQRPYYRVDVIAPKPDPGRFTYVLLNEFAGTSCYDSLPALLAAGYSTTLDEARLMTDVLAEIGRLRMAVLCGELDGLDVAAKIEALRAALVAFVPQEE
jgi:hypothetical protein